MDINAISSIKVPTIAVNKQAAGTTQTSVQKTDSANETQKSGINYKKAAPYIAGAVILAGLGIYFGRKRLVKGVKIKPKEPVNPAGEVPKPGSAAKTHAPEASNPSASSAPKAPEKPQVAETKSAADAPKAQEKSQVAETKPAADAPKAPEKPQVAENKPVADAPKAPEKPQVAETKPAADAPKAQEKSQVAETKPAADAPKAPEKQQVTENKPVALLPKPNSEVSKTAIDAKKPNTQKTTAAAAETTVETLKLDDKKVFEKIEQIRKEKSEETNRIIQENTHDGFVDLTKLYKASKDFVADAEGRGENRFHQAANLLEQSMIKAYIKGDEVQKSGLQAFFDKAKSEPLLFDIYKNMTVEEAASRVKYLVENDLKAAKYEDMDAKTFFDNCIKIITDTTKNAK